MKERPVLFSGPMIRALLREVDPKTMTRRVMAVQPPSSDYELSRLVETTDRSERKHEGKLHWIKRDGLKLLDSTDTYFDCPYGVVGDRLWVRETLGVVANWGTIHYVADDAVCYDPDDVKAGFPFTAEAQALVERYGDSYFANERKCIPSIFMPRWASRITLEITDVKVERVQDISANDALAEGVAHTEFWTPREVENRPFEEKWWDDCEFWSRYPQMAFRKLWDSINAERGHGWDKNDWVWALTFKRIFPEHEDGRVGPQQSAAAQENA